MQVHGRSEHWQVYNAIYLDFRLGFWWPPSESILVSYGFTPHFSWIWSEVTAVQLPFLSQYERILLFRGKVRLVLFGISFVQTFFLLWMFGGEHFPEPSAGFFGAGAGCIRWCTAFWCTKTWTPTLRWDGPAIGTLRVFWSQIATNDMIAAEDFWENLRKFGVRFHVEIEFAEDSSTNVGNIHAIFPSHCTFRLPPLNLQVTSLWCPMKKRTLDTELQNPTEQIFPPKHTPYKMTVMGGWEIF